MEIKENLEKIKESICNDKVIYDKDVDKKNLHDYVKAYQELIDKDNEEFKNKIKQIMK